VRALVSQARRFGRLRVPALGGVSGCGRDGGVTRVADVAVLDAPGQVGLCRQGE
jgi:hypothetical protein